MVDPFIPNAEDMHNDHDMETLLSKGCKKQKLRAQSEMLSQQESK